MNYVESFNLFGVEAKQTPCINDKGAPTTATEGAVGCLYMDTDTGAVYKCTAVTGGVYSWQTIDETNVVQTTGDSETAVMSQKAVTDVIVEKVEPDNIVDGCHIGSTEDVVTTPGWSTVYFTVTPYTRYCYSGLTTVGNNPVSGFYDSKGNRTEMFKQAVGTNSIIVPEGAVSLRFSVRNTDIEAFCVSKSNFVGSDIFAETMSQKLDASTLFEEIDPQDVLGGYYLDERADEIPYTGLSIVSFAVAPFVSYEYGGLVSLKNTPRSAFYKGDKRIETFKQASGVNRVVAPAGADNLRFSVEDADLESFTFKKIKCADSEATVINTIDTLENTKQIKCIKGDFSSILEYGSLAGATGADIAWTARLRFSEIVKEPFSVFLNDGFHIFSILYYDKETDDYLGYDYEYGLKRTEFISNGDRGIRLVIYKHATENEAIPESEIPLVFKNTVVANSEKIAQTTCGYTNLKDLPDPTSHITAVVADKSGGMIWSDKSVWRWAKNNELAISARRYKTIKVSDGLTKNEKDSDTVESVHSISKALGALVAVRWVSDWNEAVEIVESDVIDTSTKCVQAGDVLSYDALLNSSLIQSDNNAANALMRLVGKIINPSVGTDDEARAAHSAQAEVIAQELGMTNTSDFRSQVWSLKSTATDICKMFKHIAENVPTIMDIWGKTTYDLTVAGTNPRTWTITGTTSSQARLKVPEYVGGKTGSSDTEGGWGFVWRNPNDNELYITVLLGYTLATGDKTMDGRQIIDEVYSLS